MCEIANHLTRSSKVSSTLRTYCLPSLFKLFFVLVVVISTLSRSLIMSLCIELFRCGASLGVMDDVAMIEEGNKCNDAIRLKLVMLCNNSARRRSLRLLLTL